MHKSATFLRLKDSKRTSQGQKTLSIKLTIRKFRNTFENPNDRYEGGCLERFFF